MCSTSSTTSIQKTAVICAALAFGLGGGVAGCARRNAMLSVPPPNKGNDIGHKVILFRDRPCELDLHVSSRLANANAVVLAEPVQELDACDPLTWLQRHTQTKDPHWREAGAKSPYRPFPDKPYFRPIIEALQQQQVLFCAKSRDLMLSWLFVGYFTHDCMTTQGVEVLFQSQTEEKAAELVDYAKILYSRQDQDLKKLYPLDAPLAKQSRLELNFRRGNRIVGIPHGADKIRSYHPTALFIDEAAFVPDAGQSYDEAVAACQKIAVLSSAN